MADIKIKKPKRLRKVSTRLFVIIGMLFFAAAVLTVVLVNVAMREKALKDAETKAQLIIDRNLATHMYFSHQLKPKLFELTDPIIPDNYFEPSWMSSTYAVREIDKYFRSLFEADYYYKECAINARSPENEADAYEKAYLEEINSDSGETLRSAVRIFDGKPFLEILQPGETLEQSCMRCHSSPEQAPGDLVRYYGPDRSFHRIAGETVSAISIRIPLAAAYAAVEKFSMQLSTFLLIVLFSLFVLLYFANNHIIFKPLSRIHQKAVRLSSGTSDLGEEIPLPAGRELNQLTAAFNSMLRSLREHMDNLETLIAQRTAQLSESNQQLKMEMEARGEEEKRFRLLTELSPVGIYQTDLKGDCVYVNSTWCHMTGLSLNEALGSGWVNGLHPEDLKEVKTKWYATAHSEGEWGLEYRFQTSEGKIIWVYGLAKSIRDKNGNITGYMGINIDITEKKQAKKILQESESRYQQTFETNQAVKLIIDPDAGRIVDANMAACSFYGYSRKEILARKITDINILPPEKVHQEMAKAAAEKRLYFNFRHRLASGEIRDVEVYSGPVTLKDKNLLYSIIHDVTDRKHAEARLKESEDRWKSLSQSSPDHIVLLDDQLRIEFANYASPGLTVDDLIGKKIIDFLDGDNKERIQSILENVLRNDLPSHYETTYETPGNTLYYESVAIPRKSNEQIVGITISARDITDRKTAEREKFQLEAQLRQSQKMESIGTLAGGIAHDFNNILSSIIGFTELALDDAAKGSAIEDGLQEIFTAGKRARDLVKQILAFARQSEGEIKPLQVNTIAKEVLTFIRSTIPTAITIKQKINSDSLIMGNQTQVHQIIMNLCTNAAQAMEDRGGILEVKLNDVMMDNDSDMEVKGLKPGNYLELTISDTGAGIDPEIIDKIFEPYFTTKELGQGTGMGLAMVHGIVENYGGKVTVNSTPGQGTLFAVYLPLIRQHGEQRTYEPEVLPTGTERILFVDDEAPLAKMGSQILERLGYSVTTRTSSMEALELFCAEPNDFDLVISDVTMPNMTGDELAIEMMKIRPGIPLILCSGYSKKISNESSAHIGIKAFAYKPIVKADLAKTVRKVLDDAGRARA